jgi:hypothetical protein
MPKERRARERKTAVEGVAATIGDEVWQTALYACGLWLTSTIISQLGNPPRAHQRPRTRAWTKQENESRRTVTAVPPVNPARRISSRQRGLQPGEINHRLNERRRDQPQASTRITPRTKQSRRPSINKSLSAKRVGKQVAKSPAKKQVKTKQSSGRRREDQDKGDAQRRGGTGQLQVTTPLRSI